MSERTYADLDTADPPKAEIVVSPPIAPVEERHGTLTPLDLLRMAVSQNADIEKITKFVEWYEKREAQKAFAVAMKQFKATPPVIVKNKQVHYATKAGGMVDYRHATLDNACAQIIPALSTVGITHAWKVVQDKDLITVICVLTGFGHNEETQMTGSPDTSGDKSPLKAFSSTVTHLQRYTLLSACGLAASDDDETENHSNNKAVPTAEMDKHVKEMANAKDMPELKFLFTIAYEKAEEIGDRPAMARYIAAKDKRKGELNGAH